jgi:DNA-damage-inducible protein J
LNETPPDTSCIAHPVSGDVRRPAPLKHYAAPRRHAAGYSRARVPQLKKDFDFVLCLHYNAKQEGGQAMSKNQLVQAHVSGEIKAQATAVLAEIGLTVSEAVQILLTKVARDKMLPLELLTPNETTLAAMADADAGKVETVTIDEIRAAIRAND